MPSVSFTPNLRRRMDQERCREKLGMHRRRLARRIHAPRSGGGSRHSGRPPLAGLSGSAGGSMGAAPPNHCSFRKTVAMTGCAFQPTCRRFMRRGLPAGKRSRSCSFGDNAFRRAPCVPIAVILGLTLWACVPAGLKQPPRHYNHVVSLSARARRRSSSTDCRSSARTAISGLKN